MPDFQPPTPVVSNIHEVESRILVKSLSLKIMVSRGVEVRQGAGSVQRGSILASSHASLTALSRETSPGGAFLWLQFNWFVGEGALTEAAFTFLGIFILI